MSGTFVKLFGSILNSSVWCADGDTKLVWITMLLLADADGNVWGAVPGLARQAGVELEDCRRAIDYLAAPDTDSRTPEMEGRRIVPIDGGWRIVNARKYREMQTSGQLKASERSKRYRKRKRVTQRDDRDASRSSRREGEVEVDVLPSEERTDGGGAPSNHPGGGRRNPLADRPALVAEAFDLVTKLSALTGQDPAELMAEASSYEGCRRRQTNPSSMTDDRLLNTVMDLRANLADAEANAKGRARA